ncbi:MAG: hypothetical protein Q8R91_02400, partial [Candidatus Omnitrophota bacterium]|nr:hypothetical protein [Candidatus Omnitrophota bacterium]
MAQFLKCYVKADIRLPNAEYLFEFEGRVFRLVRGIYGEPPQLLTITDSSVSEDEKAYDTIT